MTRYEAFDIEKFATDVEFRQWVFHPDSESNAFWQAWISAHPDKEPEVRQARVLLETLHQRFNEDLSDGDLKEDIEKLVRSAAKASGDNVRKQPVWPWLRRAAAVVGITAGLGWLYATVSNRSHLTARKPDAAVEKVGMISRSNHGKNEMTILLSDKSVATLMPGSTLTYPGHFSNGERKVSLIGEAFFDVAKDPRKPFLVYANETVTKVLGTSFRIRAFEQDADVTVLVKTGRVSVYPLKSYRALSDPSDREVTGVILHPNQQVVFRKKESRLEKGIVASPALLSVTMDNADMIFDEKPVGEILGYLENIYGISIVFDKESLASCVVSTQFNEENLKQRLSVICQAIGATYEIIDGQIIVNSKGCGS